MTAKHCQKCKTTSVSDSDKFCYKCGKELIVMSKCKKCKRTIWEFEDYCPKCGTQK